MRWLRLLRARSEGIAATLLHFTPHDHLGDVQLTYRVLVPRAGTCTGIRFPGGWPKLVSVHTLRWVGGHDIIVPSNGVVPAHSLGTIRFWTKRRGILELVLGVAAVPGLRASAVCGNPKMTPTTIFVPATENGRQTTVTTWAQGGPRT